MSDISVPMDWQPGDAVIAIHKSYDSGYVGIIIEILRYDAYIARAAVYWPCGLDFINVDALSPAFC